MSQAFATAVAWNSSVFYLGAVTGPMIGGVILALSANSALEQLKAGGLRVGIICDVGLTPSVTLRGYLEHHGLLGGDERVGADDLAGARRVLRRHEIRMYAGGAVARGEQLYLTSCVSCHGVGGAGTENAHIPDDPEIPLLLDNVRPLHHIVRIDYVLPGCPPSAEAFWYFLTELMAGRDPSLPRELIRFD